jgi:hexokinase
MFGAAREVKQLEAMLATARRRGKTAEARAIGKKLDAVKRRAAADTAMTIAAIAIPPTIY